MISGIDLSETQDFVVSFDKKNPTTWQIGAVPSTVSGNVALGLNWEKTVQMAQLGIRGWDNFTVNEKQVEFKTSEEFIFGKKRDVIPVDIVDLIPPNALIEIASAIYKMSKLTQKEQKN